MANEKDKPVGVIHQATSVISQVLGAVFSDGTLQAAARQGADEIGMALKAFPESIQAAEYGTLWSPTPGEIAADRSAEPDQERSSPSEILSEVRAEQQKTPEPQTLSWVQKEHVRKEQTDASGSDQSEQQQSRNLAAEQHRSEMDSGRGGRGL